MKTNYEKMKTVMTDKSGCFFANKPVNTMSDMCAKKFGDIEMPIIDRSRYIFDTNWLINIDPHMVDGVYIFSKDARDASTRWHDSVSKYYDLAANCREAKEKYTEHSEEYKDALQAKKDYIETVKSFYNSLPHHVKILAYTQDTLCCFGAMTSNFIDKKGNVHIGGRIRWADEANNKVANPSVDPMTGYYRSYGMDFWSKLWEDMADEILSHRPEAMNDSCFVAHQSIEEMEMLQEYGDAVEGSFEFDFDNFADF